MIDFCSIMEVSIVIRQMPVHFRSSSFKSLAFLYVIGSIGIFGKFNSPSMTWPVSLKMLLWLKHFKSSTIKHQFCINGLHISHKTWVRFVSTRISVAKAFSRIITSAILQLFRILSESYHINISFRRINVILIYRFGLILDIMMSVYLSSSLASSILYC